MTTSSGQTTKARLPHKNIFRSLLSFINEYPIIYAVIGICVVLSVTSDAFLNANNIMNVLRQTSMIAILAAGTFLVIVGGGIDISIGSVVGLTGIIFSIAIVKGGINPLVAAGLAMLIGIFVGLINGFMDGILGIPPLIATLGMQSLARGLTYVITDAYPISGLPKSIDFIGRGYFFGIPWPVIFMAVVFITVGFLSSKTTFGRFVYASGGNPEAAYLSGIKVKLVKIGTYVIGGFLASISGIILVSRLASGQPNAGLGWEFEAIIAVVIGGVSVIGGKGKILGVLMGAILVGLLTNGMTLLNVSSYYQQIIKGLVLVTAIGLDVYKTKNSSRVKNK